MLAAAAADRGTLAAVVATLHRHCLLTSASPPLAAFNELLRLANRHRDRASADRLVEVLHNNRMQADAETWARLRGEGGRWGGGCWAGVGCVCVAGRGAFDLELAWFGSRMPGTHTPFFSSCAHSFDA